jgi:hypothetical protein
LKWKRYVEGPDDFDDLSKVGENPQTTSQPTSMGKEAAKGGIKSAASAAARYAMGGTSEQ